MSRTLRLMEVMFFAAALILFVAGGFLLRPITYIGPDVPGQLAARDAVLMFSLLLAAMGCVIHCLWEKTAPKAEQRPPMVFAVAIAGVILVLAALGINCERTAYSADQEKGTVTRTLTFNGMTPANKVGVGNAFNGTRTLDFSNELGKPVTLAVSTGDAESGGALSKLGLKEGKRYSVSYFPNSNLISELEAIPPDMVEVDSIRTI